MEIKSIDALDFKIPFSEEVLNKSTNSSLSERLKKLSTVSYSFAGGFPSHEVFPIDQIRAAADEALGNISVYQYADKRGEPTLIEAIRKLTYKNEKVSISEENIITTVGAQHGLFLLGRIMDGTIVVEDPTYFGALEAFGRKRKYSAIPLEEDGMSISGLENAFKSDKNIGFVYVIPDFQNPTGITMSLEKRMKLAKLAQEYTKLIVEDIPYREINPGEHLPSIFSINPSGTISVQTASKIISPGFRVGWIIADEKVISALAYEKSESILCSSPVNEAIIASCLSNLMKKDFMEEYGLVSRSTINYYKQKLDKLLESLKAYMPSGTSWTKPEGGLVLLLTIPDGLDAETLLSNYAAKKGVSFMPGNHFYANSAPKNTLRLAFGLIPYDKIQEGTRLLAESISEYHEGYLRTTKR